MLGMIGTVRLMSKRGLSMRREFSNAKCIVLMILREIRV